MPNILVVDDEIDILSAVSESLEDTGYSVTTAVNGKEGLKCFQQKAYDLVITDLIMPEMDGIEFIQKMRNDNPYIKIIAMSGGGIVAPAAYLSVAEKFGAMKIFDKPVTIDEILKAVSDLLAP